MKGRTRIRIPLAIMKTQLFTGHVPHYERDSEHDDYHHVPQQMESQPDGINNLDFTIKPLDT